MMPQVGCPESYLHSIAETLKIMKSETGSNKITYISERK